MNDCGYDIETALLSPSLLAKYDYPKYTIPKHWQLIDDKLIDISTGACKRLLVNMPPRHGKSELISKYFLAWYLLRNPDKRIIFASYEADFAASWGRKTRELIEKYGGLFGIKINPASNASNRFDLLGRQGGMVTAGAGGSITGKGAHVLVIDDPVKNDEQANSPTYREKVWDWFRATALTRLEPDGTCVIVQTRWHYDDLTGRLLKEFPGVWQHLELPAICVDENDLLGREIGEPLWKERYNIDNLNEIKRDVSSYWFSALYQQKPIATEYLILNPKWFVYRNFDNLEYDRIIQVWDTAAKDGDSNDYSVCCTFGEKSDGYYLIDVLRKKMLFPDLERAMINNFEKFKPSKVLIEDASSGQGILQTLKRNTKIPIMPIAPPTKNKETRASLISGYVESGRVFIPNSAPWLLDFIEECSQFPYGKHDDQIDSFTHGMQFLTTKKPAVFVGW